MVGVANGLITCHRSTEAGEGLTWEVFTADMNLTLSLSVRVKKHISGVTNSLKEVESTQKGVLHWVESS